MARKNYIRWYDNAIRFLLDQHAWLVFIVLTNWNKSPRVNISLYSDTLSWLQAKSPRVNISLYSDTLSWLQAKSPRVNISLYLDTLSWLQANQFSLLFLNAACLAVNQQIPIK
jgi:hypothetical protein